MFNTLRFRLWLTYALLICLVLFIVGTAMVVVIYRGNIPIQQASLSLQILRANALPRLRALNRYNPASLQVLLEQNSEQIRGRIVVMTNNGRVIADTLNEENIALPDLGESPIKTEVGALPKFYRDNQGQRWYYIIDEINQNRLVLFAVRRPRLQFVSIFRDQFLGPLVQAGLIALFTAIILSLTLSQWVSAPLKRISLAAYQVTEGQAQPIPLEGPAEVRQLASAFNDMSQRVQETQQAQKDFVANVSHELKTPLTSIQGFARAIQDGTAKSKSELTQAAEVIDSEATRMHRLIQDLLTLTKMDAGTAAFEMQPINLQNLLDAVVIKFSPRAIAAGVAFESSHPDLPAFLQADPDRLIQVFDNLLDNALKFTPQGGKISFFSQIMEEHVKIHVVDTGEGIPQTEQKRIFERFYQVDNARPGGKIRGYGLGLAISQQIVEAHSGSISLTSSPGEGSHFMVKLPLRATPG